jgi:ferredoxin
MKSSTRTFYRAGRQVPGYSLFDFIHGYVYGRWPYLYIGIGTGEHRLSGLVRGIIAGTGWILRLGKPASAEKAPSTPGASLETHQPVTFADTYHGKVVPLPAATQLVRIDRDLRLTNLEHIVPYAKARDIVMHDPDHIVVLECPCRAARPNPCLPLDVCLIVGEPFASFVLDHHPRRARSITSQDAVAILHQEDERGHVHHAFFKDAMLGRFYAICNCCSCCCGAMQAHQQGTPMLASSGYVAATDLDSCSGCGICVPACPFEALSLDGGHSRVSVERCMGCGICTSRCPNHALTLALDPSRGEPLEIFDMMQAAGLG